MQGWWNAGDVAEYWRLWNMPVHKWLLRHVYYPCMRLGMGKWWAGTVVFAISAAFHELLIGLPLHMVTFWAFIGLMCQVRCQGRNPVPDDVITLSRLCDKLHGRTMCMGLCVCGWQSADPAGEERNRHMPKIGRCTQGSCRMQRGRC